MNWKFLKGWMFGSKDTTSFDLLGVMLKTAKEVKKQELVIYRNRQVDKILLDQFGMYLKLGKGNMLRDSKYYLLPYSIFSKFKNEVWSKIPEEHLGYMSSKFDCDDFADLFRTLFNWWNRMIPWTEYSFALLVVSGYMGKASRNHQINLFIDSDKKIVLAEPQMGGWGRDVRDSDMVEFRYG